MAHDLTNWIQARFFIIGVIYVLIELALHHRRTTKEERPWKRSNV